MNSYSAFLGKSLLRRGSIETVLSKAKKIVDSDHAERLVIYSDENCMVVDFDYRGTIDDVIARLPDHPVIGKGMADAEVKRGPGRPKLGVVSREVTLLPRHWEWLNSQRGGASVTIRKLVDEARRISGDSKNNRVLIDKIHKFLWDIASDLPGFEEASRDLFAGQFDEFFAKIKEWPEDIVGQVHYLMELNNSEK